MDEGTIHGRVRGLGCASAGRFLTLDKDPGTIYTGDPAKQEALDGVSLGCEVVVGYRRVDGNRCTIMSIERV